MSAIFSIKSSILKIWGDIEADEIFFKISFFKNIFDL